ncbi:hypothetical protein BBP40_005134 [Aspergillus hancockii]|nr:hypothetical protein BBP40_005134 [Aspergillus hancockii]
MVDTKTHGRIHANENTVQHDDGGPDVADENPPKDPFLLLLPASIHGFGFHDEKGLCITEIAWNIEAFNHLFLRHIKKELLKALIASHSGNRSNTPIDVFEGKGKGLPLLHGGPGTGRLSPQSLLWSLHIALYTTSPAETSARVPRMSKGTWKTIFNLGTKWDCAVLLDEADNFLEERSPVDLQRNAL